MIEIVTEAETLRAIQTEWGLTGSFKDKPIAEWLAKHNPSELEYQRARDNFTGELRIELYWTRNKFQNSVNLFLVKQAFF